MSEEWPLPVKPGVGTAIGGLIGYAYDVYRATRAPDPGTGDVVNDYDPRDWDRLGMPKMPKMSYEGWY